MTNVWFYYSVVLPAAILLLGYILFRVSEWQLDRKIKRRQTGQPGE